MAANRAPAYRDNAGEAAAKARPKPKTKPSGAGASPRAGARPSASGRTAAAHRAARKNSGKFWQFLKIVCFSVFLLFALNVIISNQEHIAAQKTEIAKLEEEKSMAIQLNDEYNRLLNAKSDHEYMMEAAFEHGYAYPWEKRFFPVNNPE